MANYTINKIAYGNDTFTIDTGVTGITTTAGAHTAITNSTGAVGFNVPTTASHVGALSASGTNLTNAYIYGSSTTKVSIGATNSIDSTKYLLGATATAPFLYDDTNNSTIWTGLTTDNVTTSGEFSKIPKITSEGALKVGSKIWFNTTSGSTVDASINCTGSGQLTITASSGISSTGSITLDNTKQFGVKTSGDNPVTVHLCSLNSSNTALFGHASYATAIRGSSITIQGSGLSDFVVEKGSKTGSASGPFTATVTWYYRKWNSGKVEAWGIAQGSCALSTSDGGGYRSAWLTVSFPSDLFSSAPRVWCNAYNAATSSAIGAVVGGSPPSTTSTGSWAMFRVTSITTAQTRVFEFYCKQE